MCLKRSSFRDEVDAREREFYQRRRKEREETREKVKGHWGVAMKNKAKGKLTIAKAVQMHQQQMKQQQKSPWTVQNNCNNVTMKIVDENHIERVPEQASTSPAEETLRVI